MEAWNGRVIFRASPDLVIESYASSYGWGARCGNISFGGCWTKRELSLHINCLDQVPDAGHGLLLHPLKNGQYIGGAVCEPFGGSRSKALAEMAKDFWHFSLQLQISVTSEYLPGSQNTLADWNSRFLEDSSDWRLDRAVFLALMKRWGPCTVDLFASRWNAHLSQYFSWRPDPGATAVDAFLQDWGREQSYAFPPFLLIPRVTAQIHRQGRQ
ncbi:hypothetical protein NDU88_009960 [Pleurodeles waltl]|uniref:Uncharacterized protein n=1 Tax=Pleurodeles waltl TaxID=8319 RepID=A0AAV7QUK3_PLEWA|nr:hypothetical protein NDU88_009960 [Pleurodeles waltl]